MKTNWDYTDLAKAYLKRPDYDKSAIAEMLKIANTGINNTACDIGAGVAHLSLLLADMGLKVTAVEPNDAMRSLGIKRTNSLNNIKWIEGTGENTPLDSSIFDIVTFGSSFNVCDQQKALQEASRLLKPNGWIGIMWNHRDLDDPLQKKIELLIMSNVKNYSYGSRRCEQEKIIDKSKLFNKVIKIENKIIHSQKKQELIEAWRSHATLQRQAKDKFPLIISQIKQLINSSKIDTIKVPYTTRIWMAQAV